MSDKLFVVGNGFDLAHKLPTRYSDFKKYIGDSIKQDLRMSVDDKYLELDNIPHAVLPQIHYGSGEKSGVLADYDQEKKIMYWLIDDAAKRKRQMNWNEFEAYLGELNFKKILNSWGNDEWNVMGLRETVTDISAFFFEWINAIDLNKANKLNSYSELIDGNSDYAISFNYTETLEQLYGMDSDNICYIHGKRENNKVLQEEKRMTSFGENNCELIIGFDAKKLKTRKYTGEVLATYVSLIKDTESIMYTHREFFEKISYSMVKEIHTIGFSFSTVDMPYIKKICSMFNENIGAREMIWYLSRYNSVIERIKFRMKLRKSGFRGKIVKSII